MECTLMQWQHPHITFLNFLHCLNMQALFTDTDLVFLKNVFR
jgi:hypothetical protein